MVLPGVGSFSVAIERLERLGFVSFLKDWVQKEKPLIGICLGMHLLAGSGTEGGMTPGLNLLPGEVTRLSQGEFHTGWNSLKLLQYHDYFNTFDNKDFYFNHSYVLRTDNSLIIAMVDFKEQIPAIVNHGSVFGLQFHPERAKQKV